MSREIGLLIPIHRHCLNETSTQHFHEVSRHHVLQCGHRVIADHQSLICGINCKLPGSLDSRFICQACLVGDINDSDSDGNLLTKKAFVMRRGIAAENLLLTMGCWSQRQIVKPQSLGRWRSTAVLFVLSIGSSTSSRLPNKSLRAKPPFSPARRTSTPSETLETAYPTSLVRRSLAYRFAPAMVPRFRSSMRV